MDITSEAHQYFHRKHFFTGKRELINIAIFFLLSSLIIFYGSPHADTLRWIEQIYKFQEVGFFGAWAYYTEYPPLAQIYWYLISYLVGIVPGRILISISSLVVLPTLYIILRRKRVPLSELLVLYNPYFLITGIANGYTDAVFTIIALASLFSLFERRSEKEFLIIGFLAFLFKFQFIYIFGFLGLRFLKRPLDLFNFLKQNKYVIFSIGILILLLATPLPFYEGKLARPLAFLYSFVSQFKGFGLLVAGVPNFPSLVMLFEHNFNFPDYKDWGKWVWIEAASGYRPLFLSILSALYFFLIWSPYTQKNKLLLLLMSVLLFAPNIYSNHIGILFPVLFYLLAFGDILLRKFYCWWAISTSFVYPFIWGSTLQNLGLNHIFGRIDYIHPYSALFFSSLALVAFFFSLIFLWRKGAYSGDLS